MSCYPSHPTFKHVTLTYFIEHENSDTDSLLNFECPVTCPHTDNLDENTIARKLYDNKTVLWPRSHLSIKSLQLLYNAGEGNVLTRPRFQAMQRIEDRLVHVQGYSDLCQMTRRRSCVPPLSMLRFFDGTYSAVDPVFDDPNFENIDRVIYAAYTNNATKGQFTNFLGKSHTITPTRVHVTLTRTIIPFAGSSWSQIVADTDFMLDKFQPLLVDFLESEDFEFLYYSETMMIAAAKNQGFQDMKLAIGSILFIFAFILFHTRSLWVTCLGVFSIVCSFAETNLIYRVVIGFRYFGFFHVLAMFINLGIGADDLFVFWDAWQASQLRPFPSLAHRLDDAYRKSAISMLVTSLTTTLAFSASALSPLLATMSFGVFSAILVAIDYISVIIFFPTIVIMHHLCFENNRCLRCCLPCCGCNQNTNCKASVTPNDQFTDGEDEDRNTVTDATTTAGHAAASRHSVSSCQGNTSVRTSHMNNPTSSDTTNTKYSSDTDRGGADSQTKADDTNFPISFIDTQSSRKGSTVSEPRELPGTTVGAAKGGEDVVRREHRRLVVFFSDYYLRFVTHRVWRWVLLAVMMAVVVVFAVSAARLTPDDKQVGLFKESHRWSRAYRLTSGGFVPNEQESSIQLWLVWGIRERDMCACHFSDYTCTGRQQYDDTFDPSTLAAQRSFVELCDTLSNLTDQQVADLNIRRDFHSGQPKISCFTHNLHAFLREDSVLTGLDTDMPWDGAKVSHFMTSLESYYDTSIINSSYRHYLDIPVNYWLWDGFRRKRTADYAMFNDLLVEERTEFTSRIPAMPSVKVGNRLKFIGVQVSLNLHYATLSYKEHLPVLKRWESLMQRQLSKMPRELQSGFQVAQVAWELLHVQKSLVDNAVMGIILGVTLALPILVVSTCNVINGVLATLTICCVTVCVIGVVPMAGWKLGVLVSLNMSLVVGLAVDYVVHLAEGYHMSQARDRKSRLMHALETMGISVFSGACTTLGASTFMLFAQIQFFYQFGIFMFCTIGFSLVFSLGLYVTVMGMVGPEGDTGDIRVLLRACVERCKHHKLPHQR
ncbi:protein dispatched homolog 1-like [Littorina saxatilis]|uniref:protein dispatched homolog 1-like n=1 Tax=Littorina saxatilis TaxID=31220 RepID=UPI0038B5AABB